MNSKTIKFNNSEGNELSAKLELPAIEKPLAYAIFAHCFTCSKDLSAVVNISRALAAQQIAVLRFDFTGLGQSKGEFADSNFSSNIEDLNNAYDMLDKDYEAPSLIIGHSLGGAAVIAAAKKMKAVKAIVTIGAPYDPIHAKNLLDSNIDELKEKGEATISIGGRPFKIKEQLINDLEKNNLQKDLEDLKKSLLVIHSPQDKIVGINNAREIYEAAMHPKSFVTLDGADHLLSNKADSIYVGNIISAWVARYITYGNHEKELTTDHQVIAQIGNKGYTTIINTGNHNIIADEPKSVGGADLGPSPYDLLASALGACTTMTLRMYADRKKWPLDEVQVHLDHDKVHAEDCENCEDKVPKMDQISRDIALFGELDEKQKKRLIEIADKCPVHQTLEKSVKVITSLKT